MKFDDKQLYFKVRALWLLPLIFLFLSCSNSKDTSGLLVVGTFNVAWLGDGVDDINPRTDQDCKNIADLISTSNPDLLALQEVENVVALKRIIKYLPGYKYVIWENSREKQNVAIVYSKEIKLAKEYIFDRINFIPDTTRPGIIIEGMKGGLAFTAIAVHLKSTSGYDNTAEKKLRSFEIRTVQADMLSNFADSLSESRDHSNLILFGDFNDNPRRKRNMSLGKLAANRNLIFLTRNLKSCKNKLWETIDHIVVSKELAGRYVRHSVRMINFNYSLGDKSAKIISDHCPVFASFTLN